MIHLKSKNWSSRRFFFLAAAIYSLHCKSNQFYYKTRAVEHLYIEWSRVKNSWMGKGHQLLSVPWTKKRLFPQKTLLRLTDDLVQNNVLEVIFNHLYYIFIETNLLDKLFILILWFKIVRCQIVASVKLLVVSSCPRCQIATILTWPTESRWIWHRQVRLDSHPLAPSTCKGFKFYYFCQRISGGELGSQCGSQSFWYLLS